MRKFSSTTHPLSTDSLGWILANFRLQTSYHIRICEYPADAAGLSEILASLYAQCAHCSLLQPLCNCRLELGYIGHENE
jgi:hypothetical protein